VSIYLVSILLVLDAVLIEYARRRASRSLAEASLWYGAFLSISGVMVVWNAMEPSTLAFYSGLSWIFLSSVPALYIAASSRPKPATSPADLKEKIQPPLHVVPSGPEKRALKDAGLDPDGIQAAVRTDLSPDGGYRRGLVVVTGEHLGCLVDGGPAWVARITDLESVTAESLVGCGHLAVRDAGKAVRIVARYTNACARPVGCVAKVVNDYLEARKKLKEYEEKSANGKLEEGKDKRPDDPKLDFTKDEIKDNHCPKCGLRMEDNTSVCPRCVKRAQVIVRLMGYARPYWGWLAASIALYFIGTALSLAPPYLMKRLFDDVLFPGAAREVGRYSRLGWIIVSLGAVYLLQTATAALTGRVATFFGSMVVRDLRAMVFNHLQILSLGYFDKRQSGALMSRMGNDVYSVENLMVDGIQFTLINGLMVIGIAGMLLGMNWKLGLLALLPAPMLVAFSYWFWHKVHGLWHRRWEMVSRLTAFLSDNLGGIQVVKAFGKEEQEIRRFAAKNVELYNATVGAEVMWATWRPAIGVLMQTGNLMVWYFGGRQVLNQTITPGTLVAFTQYLGMLYGPMMMLTMINNFLTSSFSATERVFEIMDAKPDVKDADDAQDLPRMTGAIEFKGVTFGYDPLKPVLKDLELSVKPGEMIGLVGHSGAGKSTTINLICRLYDVQQGSITIEGRDVRSVKQESLRAQVGIVLQETYLFTGTIAENIAYSHPGATREEVIAAAVTANAHDFIMSRPDGYDSLVGEGGSGLSGGEKQRIAIARAILHNPRLLILDEATSSVDTVTEQDIQQALVNLMKDRTTIAIAHRLSTLQRADRLVVLENGKITEVGTHAELLEKNGTYAKLVKSQAEVAKVMTLTE